MYSVSSLNQSSHLISSCTSTSSSSSSSSSSTNSTITKIFRDNISLIDQVEDLLNYPDNQLKVNQAREELLDKLNQPNLSQKQKIQYLETLYVLIKNEELEEDNAFGLFELLKKTSDKVNNDLERETVSVQTAYISLLSLLAERISMHYALGNLNNLRNDTKNKIYQGLKDFSEKFSHHVYNAHQVSEFKYALNMVKFLKSERSPAMEKLIVSSFLVKGLGKVAIGAGKLAAGIGSGLSEIGKSVNDFYNFAKALKNISIDDWALDAFVLNRKANYIKANPEEVETLIFFINDKIKKKSDWKFAYKAVSILEDLAVYLPRTEEGDNQRELVIDKLKEFLNYQFLKRKKLKKIDKGKHVRKHAVETLVRLAKLSHPSYKKTRALAEQSINNSIQKIKPSLEKIKNEKKKTRIQNTLNILEQASLEISNFILTDEKVSNVFSSIFGAKFQVTFKQNINDIVNKLSYCLGLDHSVFKEYYNTGVKGIKYTSEGYEFTEEGKKNFLKILQNNADSITNMNLNFISKGQYLGDEIYKVIANILVKNKNNPLNFKSEDIESSYEVLKKMRYLKEDLFSIYYVEKFLKENHWDKYSLSKLVFNKGVHFYLEDLHEQAKFYFDEAYEIYPDFRYQILSLMMSFNVKVADKSADIESVVEDIFQKLSEWEIAEKIDEDLAKRSKTRNEKTRIYAYILFLYTLKDYLNKKLLKQGIKCCNEVKDLYPSVVDEENFFEYLLKTN